MGVVQREDLLYLSVTCGKLKNKKKGIEANAYEGVLVGIREREGEFEGQKTMRIEIKMKDPKTGEVALIQATKEALWALGFFARIRKVDISRPFVLGVIGSDKNEKISFCYLKQEGYKNPDPKKDGIIDKDKSFPAYTTVKVSGKDVNDYTKPFEEIDAIMKHINEKLAVHAPANVISETSAMLPPPDDSDLPF